MNNSFLDVETKIAVKGGYGLFDIYIDNPIVEIRLIPALFILFIAISIAIIILAINYKKEKNIIKVLKKIDDYLFYNGTELKAKLFWYGYFLMIFVFCVIVGYLYHI